MMYTKKFILNIFKFANTDYHTLDPRHNAIYLLTIIKKLRAILKDTYRQSMLGIRVT